MKKSTFAVLLMTIVSFSTQAQTLRIGIKGGLNYANQTGSDITINSSNYNTDAITSYHIGLLAEIRLLERFAIQPELLYSTQGASYKYALTEFKNELGYITIPVLLKFGLSKSLSLELGPQAGFLLSEKNNVDFKDSETFEFSAVGGLGLKVTKNLFLQARYGLGLTNATKNAEIKNSVVQISAGLLF